MFFLFYVIHNIDYIVGFVFLQQTHWANILVTTSFCAIKYFISGMFFALFEIEPRGVFDSLGTSSCSCWTCLRFILQVPQNVLVLWKCSHTLTTSLVFDSTLGAIQGICENLEQGTDALFAESVTARKYSWNMVPRSLVFLKTHQTIHRIVDFISRLLFYLYQKLRTTEYFLLQVV